MQEGFIINLVVNCSIIPLKKGIISNCSNNADKRRRLSSGKTSSSDKNPESKSGDHKKGPKYTKSYKTEMKLTAYLKEAIVGLLLGDLYASRTGNNSIYKYNTRLAFEQCSAHYPFPPRNILNSCISYLSLLLELAQNPQFVFLTKVRFAGKFMRVYLLKH